MAATITATTTPDPNAPAPRINGGMLDSDTDEGNAPDVKIPQTYLAAQDALVLAIQNDGSLVVANVNLYLPAVKSVLANLATVVPGAGTAVAAILKVLPDTIPG